MIRSLVKSTLRAAGVRLVREPNSAEYSCVLPLANYAPWNKDREFMEVFEAVQRNSLVDLYRCWELWTLAGQTIKLAPGSLLEVGVWRGGTGALVAKRVSSLGAQRTVYLCDTFSGVVKAGQKDNHYRGGEHADTSIEAVESLLHSMKIENAKIIKGVFPEESQSQIPESRFCFVHVDVDTYQSAGDVLAWSWERLVPSGIVVFDDYGFSSCEGVARLVGEHAGDPDKLMVHNLNGHAIFIKTAPGGGG